MAQKARVRLWSANVKDVDLVCNEIKDVATKAGVRVAGPIYLPTKHLKITTRRAPNGEGTDTYDHWEMRLHKRLIDIDADERVMQEIMRIQVPDSVYIEIQLT
ncbi:MAG: 30S ribosomal protein S10 [Thermoprotei archaeon]|jgi:small subunit ribosomal protein S10